MKKIKMLVNSIVNGSIGTQVVAGVVAVSVLGGAAFGGYTIVKNVQNQKQIQAAIEKKKEDIRTGIITLEAELDRFPEEEDVSSIRAELEELKSMDIDNDYDNAFDKYTSISESVEPLSAIYKKKILDCSTELNKLDFSMFNDEESKTFKDLLEEFGVVANNFDYKNYQAVYEKVKAGYDELVLKANERMLAEGNQSDENNLENVSLNSDTEVEGSAASGTGSSNQGWYEVEVKNPSSSSSSSSNTKPSSSNNNSSSGNNGSSNNTSSNNNPSNSGSSNNSSNASSSNTGSSNSGATTEQPSTPSKPSEWKTDVANQIVSIRSNANTNNYDFSSYMASQTKDMYDQYYSIAQGFVSGSISRDSAVASIKSVSGSEGDFKYSYENCVVKKITVSGCDANTIDRKLSENSPMLSPSFVYCAVYYDGVSDTSTAYLVQVAVAIGF